MKRRNRLWLKISKKREANGKWLIYRNRGRTAIIYPLVDNWICVMYENVDSTTSWYNKNLFLVCNRARQYVKSSSQSGGMVYTTDLKSVGLTALRVQIPPLADRIKTKGD